MLNIIQRLQIQKLKIYIQIITNQKLNPEKNL